MEQLTPQEWAREQVRRAPAFAISVAFVTGILILSTFIEYSAASLRSEEMVPIEASIAQEELPVIDEIKQKVEPERPNVEVRPTEIPVNAPVVDENVVTGAVDAPLGEVTVDTAGPDDVSDTGTGAGTDPFPIELTKKMAPIGTGEGSGGFRGALGNRSPAGKRRAAAVFGMPPQTNTTILDALRWLKKTQNTETGAWDCGGNTLGVTGLAFLAFLGNGCTDKQPAEFAATVKKAAEFIAKSHQKSGLFSVTGGCCMYTQGICTMAMAEFYGMTGHLEARTIAQEGIDYISKVQAPHGGFGYGGAGTDSSVTGFQLQATKACLAVGIEVEKELRSRIENYLSISMSKDGATPYQISPGVSTQAGGRPSTTAATLTGRLFLGHKPNAPDCIRQADFLISGDQHLALAKEAGNVYAIYYHCLSMFQMGGKYWKSWNGSFNEPLREKQIKDGADKGSWPGADGFAKTYATAMSCLALEVYFRYLPSYKSFGN